MRCPIHYYFLLISTTSLSLSVTIASFNSLPDLENPDILYTMRERGHDRLAAFVKGSFTEKAPE